MNQVLVGDKPLHPRLGEIGDNTLRDRSIGTNSGVETLLDRLQGMNQVFYDESRINMICFPGLERNDLAIP